MQYKLYLIIILFLVMSGCISEFHAELPNSDIEFLVVEGNIVANTTCEFVFSKTFSINEEKVPEEYSDINVKLFVIGNDGFRSQQAIYMGAGVYQIEVGDLNAQSQYGIEFEYEGDTYSSVLASPLRAPEIDSLSWIQPQTEGPISIQISTHDDSSVTSYYIWEYTEDWEVHPYYMQIQFLDPVTKKFYYDESAPVHNCWKTRIGKEILIATTESTIENRITDRKILEYPASDDRFMELYSILVKQRNIGKAAYEYYQTKLKQNEEMGGLFTPQPSELRGNISCLTDPSKDVIGYIDVVQNITESRLFIPYTKLIRPSTEKCPVIADINLYMGLNSISSYEELYMFHGLRVASPSGEWTYQRCTDCTALEGTTKNKPSFWSNWHQ